MPYTESSAVSSNIDDLTMHELYLWYALLLFVVLFIVNALTCIPGLSRTQSVPVPPTSCAPTRD